MPAGPEGIIKFSVIPAGIKNGKKMLFCLKLTAFNKLLFKLIRKLSLNIFLGYKQSFLKSKSLLCIYLCFADIAPC